MAIIQFLKDNVVILTLIGLGIALGKFLYDWFKDRRLLTTTTSSALLFDTLSVLNSKLEVTFDGTRIHRLWNHEITIRNSGKRDLSGSDLAAPIKVVFKDGFLEVKLQDEDPNAILEDFQAREVTLKIDLLKPGETIRLVALSPAPTPPSVAIRAKDFRIKASDKERRKGLFDRSDYSFFAGLAAIYVAWALITWIFSKSPSTNRTVLTGEEKTISLMTNIRQLSSFVQTKIMKNEKLVSPFQSNRLPEWASSKLRIEEWGGSDDILKLSRNLTENGVVVKIPSSIYKKPLHTLPDSTSFFIIEADPKTITYRAIDMSGRFLK